MTEQSKSVLDSLPQVCKVCGKTSQEHTTHFPCGLNRDAFSGPQGEESRRMIKEQPLGIVGSCPKCGSPIYGQKTSFKEDPPPEVRHTCNCRLVDASIPSMPMQTK